MSHLGDLLSALVDGELSGSELDRANAHVAACGACRVEANALRRLKHELRSLSCETGTGVTGADDITRRLLAMASDAERDASVPVRHLDRERGRRPRSRAEADPYIGPPTRRRRISRRRGWYLLWSTVSLVVVGIGTAAFGMGGGSGSTGPQITPQLEVFDVQHAIFSGDVPYVDPEDVATRVPVVAATP